MRANIAVSFVKSLFRLIILLDVSVLSSFVRSFSFTYTADELMFLELLMVEK